MPGNVFNNILNRSVRAGLYREAVRLLSWFPSYSAKKEIQYSFFIRLLKKLWPFHNYCLHLQPSLLQCLFLSAFRLANCRCSFWNQQPCSFSMFCWLAQNWMGFVSHIGWLYHFQLCHKIGEYLADLCMPQSSIYCKNTFVWKKFNMIHTEYAVSIHWFIDKICATMVYDCMCLTKLFFTIKNSMTHCFVIRFMSGSSTTYRVTFLNSSSSVTFLHW